jgi:hypothetical protein
LIDDTDLEEKTIEALRQYRKPSPRLRTWNKRKLPRTER